MQLETGHIEVSACDRPRHVAFFYPRIRAVGIENAHADTTEHGGPIAVGIHDLAGIRHQRAEVQTVSAVDMIECHANRYGVAQVNVLCRVVIGLPATVFLVNTQIGGEGNTFQANAAL